MDACWEGPFGVANGAHQIANAEDERNSHVETRAFGGYAELGDTGCACSARLFDRERDLAFDEGFANLRHLHVAAESECEIDARSVQQLPIRLIQGTTEACRDLRAFRV